MSSTLPEGFLDVFDVSKLPSLLGGVTIERGGKATHNTPEKNFLCFGQYKQGYPTIPLKAYFSILINDNSSNDQNIAILDVCDHHSDRVLGKRVITRKDFAQANEFMLFEFDFTPPSAAANMEFRIFYMGDSTIVADVIAVVDPAKVSIQSRADIPVEEKTPPEPSDYCTGNELICLPTITPDQVAKYQGFAHPGEFGNGWYKPTPNGGLEFSLAMDMGARLCMDFTIEGNIPNVMSSEEGGGKVTLVSLVEPGGQYYLTLQRMDHGYRGTGRFRLIMTDRFSTMMDQGNTLFYITTPDLVGEYSMANWGDEPHQIQLILHGDRAQLKIDDRAFAEKSTGYGISGRRQMQIVLGNRDRTAINRGQAALSRYTRFKVYYL